ncbi:hypothetical protein, partial [Streptomyces sp. NPDC005407]|uniref:hypothetical protein n=1 Tax=Streptomyces sp. NPDC005407 TaxID=3155340 RepID=UPI0033ACCBE1
VLEVIQRISQSCGATLLVLHHWNKTGKGGGHDRSSGVGPGAWGRFLISVSVVSSHTDTETTETTVVQKWMFKGDEIPDTEAGFVRKVRAEDPLKLSSEMHYSVTSSDVATETARDGDRLAPAEQKVLDVLRDAAPDTRTNQRIGDDVANKYGHGLTRSTISKCLTRLSDLGLVDDFGVMDISGKRSWGVP